MAEAIAPARNNATNGLLVHDDARLGARRRRKLERSDGGSK
jgi:hypothetical protein